MSQTTIFAIAPETVEWTGELVPYFVGCARWQGETIPRAWGYVRLDQKGWSLLVIKESEYVCGGGEDTRYAAHQLGEILKGLKEPVVLLTQADMLPHLSNVIKQQTLHALKPLECSTQVIATS